jgi:hypothetical protein
MRSLREGCGGCKCPFLRYIGMFGAKRESGGEQELVVKITRMMKTMMLDFMILVLYPSGI